MEVKTLDFPKRFSESFGSFRFEAEPLQVVKQYAQPFADEIKKGRLGSLRGSVGPVVILPGHVHEVEFIVSGINPLEFLTFDANPVIKGLAADQGGLADVLLLWVHHGGSRGPHLAHSFPRRDLEPRRHRRRGRPRHGDRAAVRGKKSGVFHGSMKEYGGDHGGACFLG